MRCLRLSTFVLSCLLPFVLSVVVSVNAQTDSGTVSGRVVDPSGFSVVGAQVTLVDIDRETATIVSTNGAGLYTFHGVHPGRYRMEVAARGFKVVNVTGLTVNTQANLEQNFALSVGSVSESVTVEAKAAEISTSVSTVVDRQFVENLPLNGRSFQTLIQLTPGVVVTPTSNSDSGQFSVNGQRASANYFMVDGVSANIGATSNNLATQNSAGTIPGFSVLGGTNNLVSVDALQEFRIQTSTFAPEFGRTPGAQVSIETRSGTNQFHGTVFEYLRNDVLDASDWFNGDVAPGTPPLKKSRERQNDFGGVLGGPIFKDKTFFFFSYEGEILRLPRTAITRVPSLAVRQDPSTPAPILPLLNAYPLPNQPATAADVASQLAPFAASFSDRSTLNAASLRIDHRINERLGIFARYNYSPSELLTRGNGGFQALNDVTQFKVNTQTLTLGSIWSLTPTLINDLRFNYSRNRGSGADGIDSFGGAVVPQGSFFVPSEFAGSRSAGTFSFFTFPGGLTTGPLPTNVQRQVQFVENISLMKGNHALKFGADYRRLLPTQTLPAYTDQTAFLDVPSAVSLTPIQTFVTANTPVKVRFRNLGLFAQDTWKLVPRLTMTYGLRWDIDFTPSTVDAPDFLALADVSDPNTLTVAASGTPIFATRYHNVAPRIGLAYLLFPSLRYQTLLRGGFGVFYDLATQQVADLMSSSQFPFGSNKICAAFTASDPACGGPLTFPVSATVLQPAPIAFSPTQALVGFDPNLDLPHTLQWNIALEQSLNDKQTISASYIGAVGRGLVQPEILFRSVLPSVVNVFGNHATSDYHALQLQFRRQAYRGLQILASYTWSHSIDTASSSSTGAIENLFAGTANADSSRGPSDFDVRHAFSAGVTYSIPTLDATPVLKSIAMGWSLDSIIQGRSATPVDVEDTAFALLGTSLTAVRPDVVPGQPLYLHGAACAALGGGSCPGGKAFNPKAFADPPVDPSTFLPVRQGDLGRNTLRGFGAFQWDLALRRTFPLRESLHLELRAELFNVLNHPNFANPSGNLLSSSFGVATTMLNRGLGGTAAGGGGFSPLYQIGGPRSGQLALKLQF
jgi:carboxypeptidase family protein/TonB-dependent receptor-like protein